MKSLTVRSKRDVIDFVNSHSNPKRGSIMVYIALGGIFIDAYDFTSLGIGVDTRVAFSLTFIDLRPSLRCGKRYGSNCMQLVVIFATF